MEGDDEGDICRVCRTGASPDRPLNYPCKCSGSIRFIHQDCLLMWLTHSKAKYCELCGHHFEFTPIYAENAPTILPPHEILWGLLTRASTGLRGALRAALVVLCWFIIVPLAASSTFYLYFGRPVYGFSLRHIRMSSFVMDCAFGTFISAMVIFVCLLIMSLMDFVNNMHIIENNPAPANIQNNNDENVNNFGLPAQNAQGNEPQHIQQPNPGHDQQLQNQEGVDAGDDDIELMGAPDEHNDEHEGDEEEEEDVNNEDQDALIAHYNEVMALFNQIPHHADLLPPAPPPMDGEDVLQGGEGEQLIDEEEDNLFGNMFFGILDGNAGEVDFNELVGLAGPLTGLLSKVIALILFNACFLALFALIPLVLGRFLLQLRHHPFVLWKALTSHFLPAQIAVMVMNATTAVKNITELPIAETISNLTSVANSTSVINSTFVANSTSVHNALVSNITITSISESSSGDIDAVVVGYLFIAFFCTAWIGVTLSLSANFALSRNPFYRTILRTLRLVLTAVKVACVMFSELGIFPLLVGNALDFCTLSLFGASLDSRMNFCKRNPLICQALHWAVGFAYMILFASFVGWVREVVRPGVLWFFRDPSDPNFNPLKDIVDQPASRHVKRLLLSAVIYAVIIGLVVYLPILIGKAIYPSLFPLNIWLGDPFYEGPIDLIFVHVIVPYTLDYCHPKSKFKVLLKAWIVFLSNKLGIEAYMLPALVPAANPAEPANAANVVNQAEQIEGEDQDVDIEDLNIADPDVEDLDDPIIDPVAEQVAHFAEAPIIANPPNQAAANPPYKPPYFWLRVLIIVNCAWMSMFVLNSLLVSLPIATGRFIFSQLSFPLTNDLYTFCAGFYAFYGFMRVTYTILTFMTSLPLPQIASEIYVYSILALKCAILGVFLGIIIPGLIGLVFELVFAIPWRVAVDQSPHFFIYQDWGLGLIYMKIWYRIIVVRAEYIRLHPPPGRPEWYDVHVMEWKAKIDQIFNDGLRNLNFTRIFTSVIFAILDKIFLMLCIPYVFAKGLVPLLGGSLLLVSAMYRYGFLFLALGITITKLQRPMIYSLRTLHNAIRDDKYLVGRRLHNYSMGNLHT